MSEPYENFAGRHRFKLQEEGATGAAMRPWLENLILVVCVLLFVTGIVKALYSAWSS